MTIRQPTPHAFAKVPDPRWCLDCDGDGRVFCARTNNPIERERWHVCGTCGGDGLRRVEIEEEE